MKRIEFIGPPGVGKSHYYSKLLSYKGRANQLINPHDLKLHIGKKEFLKKRDITGQLKLHTLSLTGLLEHKIKKSFNINHQLEIVDNKQWEPLFIALNDANVKFHTPWVVRINWLTSLVNSIIVFQNTEIQKTVIFDESVSHMLLCLSLCCKEPLKSAEKFFYAMPKPNGIIVFEADKEIIINRCSSRDRRGDNKMAKYRWGNENGITKTAIQISKLCEKIANNREIPLCIVNTNRNAVSNLKIGSEFIDNVSSNELIRQDSVQ
ncbi:hypothetical protein [Natronogracilivirga saccharolytica]|uniref:Uncharacterized protein n=1 Tax=Natronogracilivirga saccharolytica TaxID=2812953 RepID=A0A8J7RPM1_9BACT|nr:hypothetical protein [Natronogracilivirga saccharolytica]MBP3193848.1 hypothetical protein [Natronogracilivirga saccharolytica]